MSAKLDDVEDEPTGWDEARVLKALERCDKFGPPTWAFLSHVHGHVSGSRSADGVSVGLWHSRGLLIQGVEVKTSRNDWLRELKKPEKADGTVFPYCDRWWLVTPKSVSVTRMGELPDPWGHATVDGRGVHVLKEAPPLTPIPLDRPFVAELFRRAVEQFPEEVRLRAARHEGYQEGLEHSRENHEARMRHFEDANAALRAEIDSFEKVLGQPLRDWGTMDDDRNARVRRALAFVLENGHEAAVNRLAGAREHIASLLEAVDRALAEVKGT